MNKIIALFTVIILSGCGAAYDADACRSSVKEEMKTMDVVSVPDKKFTFVVRDSDGNIYFVKTMNTSDTKITYKEKIFEGNK